MTPWARGALAVLLAAILGAAGALAHAPYDFAPAIAVPLLGGFALWARTRGHRGALAIGWALGTGYFAATMTWIVEPFFVDPETTWMAPFALVLLAAGLGMFWGLAFAVARWALAGPWALAVAWAGAELLRAYLFTGFPWAAPPQALVGQLAGQALAWLGPHGLMLGLCLGVAGLFALPLWPRIGAASACAALLGVSVPEGSAPLTQHTVRLIQPNAPQDEKWDPARVPVFVNRQIDYTAAGVVPDLIVWPETALPYLVDQAQPAFDVIAEAARGAPVVLGIQRRAGGAYYNSLVMLDASGQVTQSYDKHHLVPFGEYMPFPGLFRTLGIAALAQRVDTGYAAGPGPQLMDLGALGRALPLICYEAVFAHDVGGAPARPAFLMQLTNDAWFGARSGPQQHLAQARMRAIEQGLPMIRAANTGISAVIDPQGRILQALALNTAGYFDALLPAPAAPTLYSRTGDLPWVLVILAGLIAAVFNRARQRKEKVNAA